MSKLIMTPQQKQDRRQKIMNRLMDDIQIDWCKIQTLMMKRLHTPDFNSGKLIVDRDSPEYYLLATHPHNKDRVDAIVEWNCKGFLGYKNTKR